MHFRGEFFLRPTLLVSKSTYVSSNKISIPEIAHFKIEYSHSGSSTTIERMFASFCQPWPVHDTVNNSKGAGRARTLRESQR
ncbi:MAG TPA: hypothetical protein VKA81_08845, partial [Verrucomicrobiae bacterium]|nr:hypothetical protein [Verrucomicrobiae bacterium]